ncbi:MAG: cupin domain-containing protein [Candidatus Acidiferrales bacterium]|jgi:quercetin dioxygenase-like cupin family protein
MFNIRKTVPVVLTVVAFSAGWLAKTAAQQNSSVPAITYFSHEKVDASFAKAISTDGSRVLFSRKDSQGATYTVHTNSRTKADEGQPHSHEGWTAVVVIMSGAATFVTPGTPGAAKAASAAKLDDLGGQTIGSGETHRISKGDVIIIPPGVPHVYKNVEEPFHYLVVQTPL